MKKQYYIIIAIVILIFVLAGMFFCLIKDNGKQNNEENNTENISENNQEGNNSEGSNIAEAKILEVSEEEMENMKKEINATGNTNIYQVEEEPGTGRKILQIKPSVQFEIDLAGIIKNAKPEENELKDLTSKAPTGNGVWISEQSREKFISLLKDNGIENFEITQEGYLKKISDNENSLNKQLEEMINSNKLYIINITGVAFERDYISGEILEYPFEDMDPTQTIEPYRNENTLILEVTTNKKKELTNKEILQEIVQY